MECSKWIAKTPTGTSKLSQEQNSHWGGYYSTRTPKKKKTKNKGILQWYYFQKVKVWEHKES